MRKWWTTSATEVLGAQPGVEPGAAGTAGKLLPKPTIRRHRGGGARRAIGLIRVKFIVALAVGVILLLMS